MNSQAHTLGMDRFECRDRILEDLETEGLLEKTTPYRHSVGHCYRCKTMIEPLLSKQWFVKAGPLAEASSLRRGGEKDADLPRQLGGGLF